MSCSVGVSGLWSASEWRVNLRHVQVRSDRRAQAGASLRVRSPPYRPQCVRRSAQNVMRKWPAVDTIRNSVPTRAGAAADLRNMLALHGARMCGASPARSTRAASSSTPLQAVRDWVGWACCAAGAEQTTLSWAGPIRRARTALWAAVPR